MSSNPQKNQKMCKSPSKIMAAFQKTDVSPKPQKIGDISYEQLSTNCTMVGSNNLNLVMPQIKVCAKPIKHSDIVKKPQSPRNETFIHNSIINTKFHSQNFSQLPHVAISSSNFNNTNFQTQRTLPLNKSPVPSFTNVSSVQTSNVVNNGGNLCNMTPSPSGYSSNPSPNYPNNAVSPYNVQNSSPANSISSISSGIQGIKSPVASPQNIRPPTPQPILPQAFQQIPVMTCGQNLVQIIQASNAQQTYQNPVIARQTIIAPQQQNVQSSPPVIKIKPPLNILPKPPTSTTPSKTVTRTQPQATPIQSPSQQIVLPNQTILPTAQTAGTLVLNQMPLIVQQNTAQGVQLILRPGTPNSQIAGKIQPQNLILQQGPTQQPTVLIQHGNRNQTITQQPQQLVRVLTANGMIQGIAPTYITMNNQQLNIQQIQAQTAPQQQNAQAPQQIKPNQVNLPQGIINACIPSVTSVVTNIPNVAPATSSIEQLPPPKRKPKKKKKNKEVPKLDLGSIMKLSGIGDDDDVHFESDTSDTVSEIHNNQIHKMNQKSEPTTPEIDNQFPKRIGNIHISAVTQDISKISQNTTQTNAILEKTFMQTSQISVQQSLSDINAINQNLTQIGILNQNSTQNFLNNITGNSSVNIAQSSSNIITQDGQNLANFLQALNQNQFINGQSISQNVIPVSSIPSLTTLASSQSTNLTSTYQKISLPTQNTVSISNMSNQNTESVLNLPKIQTFTQPSTSRPNPTPQHILTTQTIQGMNQNQNILNAQHLNTSQINSQHLANFNIQNPLSNVQVQNFGNQNFLLNQGTNTIIAPNIPNFSGNITINNGLIPNTNLTLSNNIVPNFLPNIVQQTDNFGGNRATGGFKLALSEDGRLILQHDPNLNQDIQSQMLLQSIFGINLQGGNLVLSSVAQPITPQPPPQIAHQTIQQHSKPIAVVEPKKQEVQNNTKTTNIIQNSISSIRTGTETSNQNHQTDPPNQNNFSYIVNLTPEQLETLKRNGQLTVNGQTIFMHRPKNQEEIKNKSPKSKIKKKPFDKKPIEALKDVKTVTTSTNTNLISALQSPIKNQSIEKPNDFSNESFPQNVVCVQPNNSKLLNQADFPKEKVEPLKKIKVDKKEETVSDVNVEQFLTNLNINPANLGQLISQKLPGVDHKIVNIAPGPTAGHIVAKIDISSENMKQILAQPQEQQQIVMPPLISMKTENDTFNAQENVQTQQPLVIAPPNIPPAPEVPTITPDNQNNRTNNTVYQRIQTIQLTPQKQQLLRSVQLQIQTLTARLQQKNEKGETSKQGDGTLQSETEIHRTLKLLYVEQQKILATGKVIPTIQPPIQPATVNCHIESVPTQTIPVTTASKNNNTYLTSLLQQPVVSHNQKVFYHHGNQIITINSNLQNTTTNVTSPAKIQVKKLPSPIQNPPLLTPKIEKPIPPQEKIQIPNLLSPKKIIQIQKPMISKAQLIEQQMTTDQNGAINPDIQTPFLNKADACKRLVRYHCYNQPVLSQKDLGKADEIFELTARHFIEKFRHMVSKYKYLLLKESMKEVQTSELMMIDRMFLAEEQQSLLKAQADLKLQNDIEHNLQEMYGESEDIKPQILNPFNEDKSDFKHQHQRTYQKTEDFAVKTEKEYGDHDFNIKCGLNYFSEESCDSNFQNYEEGSKFHEEKTETFKDKGVGEKESTSYNTTKIIGNFEIEINNKSCNNQESYTKNFRQKIIENKDDRERNREAFDHENHESQEDYDEWLCIQRELGYLPENKESKSNEKNDKHESDFKPKNNADQERKGSKRSTSSTNSLETLKKFRVDKHNSKVKKSGSIIGEVKFEVRIEHKKVPQSQNLKRSFNDHKNDSSEFLSKRSCNTNTNFSQINIKTEDNHTDVNDPGDIFDSSIDEQVQSAIDSILNLQQIASMNAEKGETSKDKNDFNNKLSNNENQNDNSTLNLDEAVKSILS